MATVCFERKSNICTAKFGNLGANGVKGLKFLVVNVILESPTLICLFTMNFYGATMMIKGSLLLSVPIVKLFQAKKNFVFGQNLTVFGDK